MGITAIFGGTFNPPHIGHYEMLRSLENNTDIEEIMLLPTVYRRIRCAIF